eukprot:979529-Pyramimonas_sp.AAC.1
MFSTVPHRRRAYFRTARTITQEDHRNIVRRTVMLSTAMCAPRSGWPLDQTRGQRRLDNVSHVTGVTTLRGTAIKTATTTMTTTTTTTTT